MNVFLFSDLDSLLRKTNTRLAWTSISERATAGAVRLPNKSKREGFLPSGPLTSSGSLCPHVLSLSSGGCEVFAAPFQEPVDEQAAFFAKLPNPVPPPSVASAFDGGGCNRIVSSSDPAGTLALRPATGVSFALAAFSLFHLLGLLARSWPGRPNSWLSLLRWNEAISSRLPSVLTRGFFAFSSGGIVCAIGC